MYDVPNITIIVNLEQRATIRYLFTFEDCIMVALNRRLKCISQGSSTALETNYSVKNRYLGAAPRVE